MAGDPAKAFGSLTSLTGGGGLSNSSSAAARSGDSSIGFNQQIGGLTIGGKNESLWLAAIGLLAFVAWLLWGR